MRRVNALLAQESGGSGVFRHQNATQVLAHEIAPALRHLCCWLHSRQRLIQSPHIVFGAQRVALGVCRLQPLRATHQGIQIGQRQLYLWRHHLQQLLFDLELPVGRFSHSSPGREQLPRGVHGLRRERERLTRRKHQRFQQILRVTIDEVSAMQLQVVQGRAQHVASGRRKISKKRLLQGVLRTLQQAQHQGI